jgi:hypothetical protein
MIFHAQRSAVQTCLHWRSMLASLALLATGSSGCIFQPYELDSEPSETEGERCSGGAEMHSQGPVVTKYNCSGVCTDLDSDPKNCGECGNACQGAEPKCENGGCVTDIVVCPENPNLELCDDEKCYAKCGEKCYDLLSDPNNCGECGNICETGTCDNGGCTTIGGHDCADGLSACGAENDKGYECVDLSQDERHCGECGTVCETGTCENGSCGGGICQNKGNTICGKDVTNVLTDADNCGECGIVCPEGVDCNSGVCGGVLCSEGKISCSGECMDLNTDEGNCGYCGHKCEADQTCVCGQCQ